MTDSQPAPLALTSTEHGLTRPQVLAIWYALCCMHAEGNAGWYTGSVPTRLNIDAKWSAAIWRQCAFYSRGWGWRLRVKSPQAWHVTMKALFPVTLADEPAEYADRLLTENIVTLWRAHGKELER